jgi:hypothetical protein
MKKLLFPLAAALIVSGGIASLASAQEWPQRTIRIVVSFGPGGGALYCGIPASNEAHHIAAEVLREHGKL